MKKSNPPNSSEISPSNSLKNTTEVKSSLNEVELQVAGSMKRRKFLGMGLFGIAGLSVPFASKGAESFHVQKPPASPIGKSSRQTDTFEEKIKLLQDAWSR